MSTGCGIIGRMSQAIAIPRQHVDADSAAPTHKQRDALQSSARGWTTRPRSGSRRLLGELAGELVANGHKAIVFSQFVVFPTPPREPQDRADIAYPYLQGNTRAAECSKRVAAFEAGHGELFLIGLKGGDFGLNLTTAEHVVIDDPWRNPVAEDQPGEGAQRIGLQRPVTAYCVVQCATLEQRIVALHEYKRDLADSVLEGGEVVDALMAQELRALMRGCGT